MMGQRLESWLLADNAQHGRFDMGLAQIELKRGAAPAIAPNESKAGEEVEIRELDEDAFRTTESLGIDLSRPERGTDEEDAARETARF